MNEINMDSKILKWCEVPQCNNTSIQTPNKLFIPVPFKETIRKKWLELARRDFIGILPRTRLYFCEDHFDMPNAMEYHSVGSVQSICIKPGCYPSKFHWQQNTRLWEKFLSERLTEKTVSKDQKSSTAPCNYPSKRNKRLFKRQICEISTKSLQDTSKYVVFNKTKQEINPDKIDSQQESKAVNSASDIVTISKDLINRKEQETNDGISEMFKPLTNIPKSLCNNDPATCHNVTQEISCHETKFAKLIQESDKEFENDTGTFESELEKCSKSCNDNTRIPYEVMQGNNEAKSVKTESIKTNKRKNIDYGGPIDYKQYEIKGCRYRCFNCKQKCKALDKIIQPYFTKHGPDKHACPQCKEYFTSFRGLRLHIGFHIRELFSSVPNLSTDNEKFLNECKYCRQIIETKDRFSHWERHLRDDIDEPQVDYGAEKLNPIMDLNLVENTLRSSKELPIEMQPKDLIEQKRHRTSCCNQDEMKSNKVDIKQELFEVCEESWQDSSQNVVFKHEIVRNDTDGKKNSKKLNTESDKDTVTIINDETVKIKCEKKSKMVAKKQNLPS